MSCVLVISPCNIFVLTMQFSGSFIKHKLQIKEKFDLENILKELSVHHYGSLRLIHLAFAILNINVCLKCIIKRYADLSSCVFGYCTNILSHITSNPLYICLDAYAKHMKQIYLGKLNIPKVENKAR